MTATLLYRISAFVLILFAAGHTLGFMTFKAPTPEGVAVQQAMDNVRFSIGEKSLTYGDFYRGLGLFCTAYLLFLALSGLAAGRYGAEHATGDRRAGLGLLRPANRGHRSQLEIFCAAPDNIFCCTGDLAGWAAWLVNAAKV